MQSAPQIIRTEDIDATDRQIIALTQAGLPLSQSPYHDIATELNLPVTDVMRRMQAMLDKGIIRRIGLVPNHYRLGFTANGMSVWNVADDKVQQLGQLIGAVDFVSHCYQRPRFLPEWPYNLFAMVHGKNREEVAEKVEHISRLLGDNDLGHDVLFSTKILKKTGLRINQ